MKAARLPRFLLPAALLLSLSFQSPAGTFTDSFSSPIPDPVWWSVDTNTTGVSAIIDDGRLELSMDSQPIAGTKWIQLFFNVLLTGDFDASVDFELLQWPSNNRARIGIWGTAGAVERISDNPFGGELYLQDVGGDTYPRISTTDLTGRLRFTRVGATVSGYFWQEDDWTLIEEHPNAYAGETALGLALWGDYVTGASVAFDNFSITSSNVPEPSSAALAGLVLLGVLSRRRPF